MVIGESAWDSVSGVSGRGSGYQSFLGQGLGIREINDGLRIWYLWKRVEVSLVSRIRSWSSVRLGQIGSPVSLEEGLGIIRLSDRVRVVGVSAMDSVSGVSGDYWWIRVNLGETTTPYNLGISGNSCLRQHLGSLGEYRVSGP